MKVLIVGLGLMGGAYAYRLSKKGHIVYGIDKNIEAINYALDANYIVDGGTDAKKFIPLVDVIVLSIYPQGILSFLNENNKYFNEKQVITDICGVKSSFVDEATKLALPANYCSHHPMAGREKIGVEFSHLCIFEGANFLITPTKDTKEESINVIKNLGIDLGFTRFSIIDIHRHDKMIGFTSQLTHAIAVSLVNSDSDPDTKNFIGDSYRDLTRIAMINENLWSELFLENKEYLLEKIKSFENELDLLKNALNDNDKEALKRIFESSTKIRKDMEK